MDLQPLVIKLGGAILSKPQILSQFFKAIATYQSTQDRHLILVHGGGIFVDEILNKLDFSIEKQHGLRVTPRAQMPYITGALAGTANKYLQSAAMKAGLNSVGLSLADGCLCHLTPIDPTLGQVAHAAAGDPKIVQAILANDALPIISSIGLDSSGELMNVNADQAAVAVADAFNANLIFLSDVAGVLDQQGKLQPRLSAAQAERLIAQGVITHGMMIKVRAALDGAKTLNRPVEIASWQDPKLLVRLFQGGSIGTQLTAESQSIMGEISTKTGDLI